MAADEVLVARVAEGDDPALAELLHRYERRLSHFIHRHTGGRDVEDIYQETWLRVVRTAARFDPARRFSTWLFQIALNLCRDWHRHNAAPPEFLGEAEPTGRDDVARVEAGIDAASLLRILPLPQREVLILRLYQDLSEEETASVLECPQGTVKSRMHNALSRLAAYVKEEKS